MSSHSGSLTTKIDPDQFYSESTPKKQPSGPKASPFAFKSSGHSGFSSSLDDTKIAHRRMADEMKGKFIGPMPVHLFLEEFLPTITIPGDEFSFSKGTFDEVVEQTRERDMYSPLIQALGTCVPGLSFVHSSAGEDLDCTFNGHNYKPDVSVYATSKDITRSTDFSQMEIAIELKGRLSSDAFQDPPEAGSTAKNFNFTADSEDSRNTRGQITTYAVAHMGSQFRSFVFSVLICRNSARLIRWDRAGAIVSRSFDYAQTQSLSEFFWRYQRLTPQQRGIDHSVTRLSPNDPQCNYARNILGLTVNDNIPLFKFDFSNHHSCIGYSTGFSATSLTGRATRCFVVYDQDNNDKIIFLKDTWRIHRSDMMKEGDVYEQLHLHQVPHISEVEFDEDIDDQRSETQKYQMNKWACRPGKFKMSCHQHYRIVLSIVGESLMEFNSSYQFVSAIRDAMRAHKHAYEKANILHRDISAGNILLTPNGGLLIDWDLSKSTVAPAKSRGRERTGTWQFISAALLIDFGREHRLEDDLESALHVTSWVGLRYLKHNLDTLQLSDLLTNMFDSGYIDAHGHSVGGRSKKRAITDNSIHKEVQFLSNPRLSGLIAALTQLIAVRYEDPPTAQQYQIKAILEDAASSGSSAMKLALGDSVAWKYDMRMRQLENSDRVLEIFEEYLEDRSKWPHDHAKRNEVFDSIEVSSRKRKNNTERLLGKIPRINFSQTLSRGRSKLEESEDDDNRDDDRASGDMSSE